MDSGDGMQITSPFAPGITANVGYYITADLEKVLLVTRKDEIDTVCL